MIATTPPLRQALAFLVVLGLLVAACSGSDEGTDEGAGEGPLRFTYDGESCTYEGPTEASAGPVTIEIVNETEGVPADKTYTIVRVNLMRHTGNQTAQDMIEYLGPEPSLKHQPLWVSNPQPVPWESPAFPGKTVIWEGDLEPGTYSLICATTQPAFGVWFGTGLIVED
jgi:hypothetical protein